MSAILDVATTTAPPAPPAAPTPRPAAPEPPAVRPPAPPAPARSKRPRLLRLALIVLAILVGAALVLALRPKAIAVDVAVAATGPVRVTVDADAVTRVRQPFTITAPVSGLVQRLAVRAGDEVRAGTPLATITTPPLHSTERRAAQARVDAARASTLQFAVQLSQAELALAQARRDEARARQLLQAGAIADRDLELASLTVASRRAELGTVRAQRDVALADLAQARAALDAAVEEPGIATVVRAPGDGRVLSVPDRSARVVAAGTPLLQFGDPRALEVSADVLSSDAAAVRAGQHVILRGWGGPPLDGTVRVVEPSARTRLSALGVEEQRLTVVIDPAEIPNTLGDGYRLDASIVTWEGRALSVPASALLRNGEAWELYAVRDGRAVRTRVQVGHVGSGVAEITGGLQPGARVVLLPPDQLRDGARVRLSR
ncbi:MAG TPA: efflux RND transporter periplasmic adaptor subunit [Gemmatimonadaceae bacterium]|nr:efflux RND transporter periplasmic adaptor subunit [Gemmatimonadaceae bacterium]